MSANKHTPGPWTIDPEYPSEVQTAGNQTISSCWHSQCEGLDITLIGILPCSLEESAANARLIAAAPDLLAALKDVMRSTRKDFEAGPDGDRTHRYAYEEQFAAIAKAEGRP